MSKNILGILGNARDTIFNIPGQYPFFHRETQNGFLTGTTLGNVVTQQTLNLFGELETAIANYQENTLYQVVYKRNKLGRIFQKDETIVSARLSLYETSSANIFSK